MDVNTSDRHHYELDTYEWMWILCLDITIDQRTVGGCRLCNG